jgi:Flp pilus assembly protein TadD
MASDLEAHPRMESAERYAQRGLSHLKEGQSAEAVVALQRALELEPKNPILHNNLAVALDQEGKKEEALAAFQEAARLKPDYADALHNLGNHLRRLGRLADAEAVYRQTLKLIPDSPDLCNHLGIALLGQAKHTEAEACFQRSLRLKPDHAEAHNNLGVLLEQLGNEEGAIASYEESIRLKPDSPDTHRNLALGYLMSGDYARGWEEYEWRWKSPANPPRPFSQPRWDGRFLHGQAVLLYSEQGLGDTIQFARYASLVQERGGVVFLECPAVLERLLSRCPGVDRVIPQGAPLPEFAFQIPLMSLPGVFRTTLSSIPTSVPYCSAAAADIDHWKEELGAISSFKIGIAWQGSQKYAGDAHRSIRLACFEPLARLPDVRLVSLQKGFGSEQLAQVNDWNVLDVGNRVNDFADTAAVIQNLDLVVCVDTAVAHLAGALGVPVWMVLSMASDWRWLRGPETTEWYPSHRFFRQQQWGHWEDVFKRIIDSLRRTNFLHRGPMPPGISPGDLLDKITMLEVTRSRIQDKAELSKMQCELGAMLAIRARCLGRSPKLDHLTEQLRAMNDTIWEIEDSIRLDRQKLNPKSRFAKLARSVYQKKDERSALIIQINSLLA